MAKKKPEAKKEAVKKKPVKKEPAKKEDVKEEKPQKPEQIVYKRIKCNLWRSRLHAEELGVYQQLKYQAKTRMFSKNFDIEGIVEIDGEKKYIIAYNKEDFHDKKQRLVLRLFTIMEEKMGVKKGGTFKGGIELSYTHSLIQSAEVKYPAPVFFTHIPRHQGAQAQRLHDPHPRQAALQGPLHQARRRTFPQGHHHRSSKACRCNPAQPDHPPFRTPGRHGAGPAGRIAHLHPHLARIGLCSGGCVHLRGPHHAGEGLCRACR